VAPYNTSDLLINVDGCDYLLHPSLHDVVPDANVMASASKVQALVLALKAAVTIFWHNVQTQ